MLIDRFSRRVYRLRIAVTGRCNYRCVFCHMEGDFRKAVKDELTAGDIGFITRVAVRLGFKSVKLTGGEPLIRHDILKIVEAVSSASHTLDVSMSTNGYFLEDLAIGLNDKGLDRVNVNIPSLKREKYAKITGFDGLNRVLAGVNAATEAGLSPVRINVVILNKINEDEIWDFIDYASAKEVSLRLIEYHAPINEWRNVRSMHASLDQVIMVLREKAEKTWVREANNRPVFLVDGVEVEVVSPMFNQMFCSGCSTLRVTWDGQLKPCLMRSDNLINAVSAIKNRREDLLKKLFLEAVIRREPYFREGRTWPE